MKTIITALLFCLFLSLTACTGAPAAGNTPATSAVPAKKTNTPTVVAIFNPAVPSLLKTAAGDFAIASARLVDEVNGTKAGPNEKILLIPLTGPAQARLDPASFSLETFDKAVHDTSQGEVHLTGSDGLYAICSMAGWVGEKYDQFAMGFRVPATAKTFQLFWPGNAPLAIQPVN
jgi:hypothetical protein